MQIAPALMHGHATVCTHVHAANEAAAASCSDYYKDASAMAGAGAGGEPAAEAAAASYQRAVLAARAAAYGSPAAAPVIAHPGD